MHKHGRYNVERHLPMNAGVARGDGTRTWLMNAVTDAFPDLAQAARNQTGDRYSWLLIQLRAMHTPESENIAEEYRQRINAAQQERAERNKLRRR